MPYPALIDPADLDEFPGGPFSASVVASAVAAVRSEVDWHIAPEYRETVQVEAADPFQLLLHTLRVVTVHSVTDEDGATVDPANYRVRSWGCLVRTGGMWLPSTTYTVDLTHGFASADDLLPVIAAICQKAMTDATITQRSETMGQRTTSESYNVNRIDTSIGGTGSGSPLDQYRLVSFGG